MQGKKATVASLMLLLGLISFTQPLSAQFSNASQTHSSYAIHPGDTLYNIGEPFGVDWHIIAMVNGIASPYTIYGGELIRIPISQSNGGNNNCADYWVYHVVPGDTIDSISAYFGVSSSVVETMNNLNPPFMIDVNQQLKIPNCGTSIETITYIVQPGDSLYSIGQEFNVSWQNLAQANEIQAPYYLYAGQSLLVPGATLSSYFPPNASPITRLAWIWLWNDYYNALSQIAQNPGTVSVISPNAYMLDNNGTFQVASADAEICPSVHVLGLSCEPLIQNDQNNPSGINLLLTSASLQSTFISSAVNEAVQSNLDGYNLDLEPSAGTFHVASQYGQFLTNFANAMHSVGKSLSVDVAAWDGGSLWNLAIEGSTTVDLVLTMETYSQSMQVFQQSLQSILSSIPINKIAVGFLTRSDDSTLSQRFQMIESNGIPVVMVWPSFPGFLGANYWGELAGFMKPA